MPYNAATENVSPESALMTPEIVADATRKCSICWVEGIGVWKCAGPNIGVHYYCDECAHQIHGGMFCCVPECNGTYLYPTDDNPNTYIGLDVDVSTLGRATTAAGAADPPVRKKSLAIKTRYNSTSGNIVKGIAKLLSLEAGKLALYKEEQQLNDEHHLHQNGVTDDCQGLSVQYKERVMFELNCETIAGVPASVSLSARLSHTVEKLKNMACDKLGIDPARVSMNVADENGLPLYLEDDLFLWRLGIKTLSVVTIELNELFPGPHVLTVSGTLSATHPRSCCSPVPAASPPAFNKTSAADADAEAMDIDSPPPATPNVPPEQPTPPVEIQAASNVVVEKWLGPFALLSEPVTGWVDLWDSEHKRRLKSTGSYFNQNEEVYGFWKKHWYLGKAASFSEEGSEVRIRWRTSGRTSNLPSHAIRKDKRRRITLDLSKWGQESRRLAHAALPEGVQGPVGPPLPSATSGPKLASVRVPHNWKFSQVAELIASQLLVNTSSIRLSETEGDFIQSYKRLAEFPDVSHFDVHEISYEKGTKRIRGVKLEDWKVGDKVLVQLHSGGMKKFVPGSVLALEKFRIKVGWLNRREESKSKWIISNAWSKELKKPIRKRQFKVGEKVKVKQTMSVWRNAEVKQNIGDDNYHIQYEGEDEMDLFPHPVEHLRSNESGSDGTRAGLAGRAGTPPPPRTNRSPFTPKFFEGPYV